jgi:uncharacterized protein involved in exopolysaccharide biosynthesis
MPLPYYLDQASRAQGGIIRGPIEETFQDWTASDRTGVGLNTIVQLWTRNKLIMKSVFLIIFAATIAWLFITPPTYEAVVKIFVKRARIEGLADRDTAAPRAEVSESDIRSEVEILRSRQLLERVVKQWYLTPPSTAADVPNRLAVALAVRKVERYLRITPITKTNIIAVTYISRDPNEAANILRSLTAFYLEKHTALHRSQETSQFFGDQARRYGADLAVAQQKLLDFQQRHEASLLDERKELNLKRVADLEAALQQINADIQDASHRSQLLKSDTDSLPPMIESQSRTARNDILLEKLKSELLDLQNKRTELLAKFEPSYRLVTEVDQQIRDTREAILREETPAVVDRTDARNPLRESTEAELARTQSQLAGLLARRESLINDIANCSAKQKAMEQLTTEYSDLQRGKAITEQNYLLYQKKTEEAHIADALDQRKFLNVSILEEAAAPALPRDKHVGVILLLGLILATTCAFVAASAAESLHPLIRTPNELTTQTSLPVLAALSENRIVSSINPMLLEPDPGLDTADDSSRVETNNPIDTSAPSTNPSEI